MRRVDLNARFALLSLRERREHVVVGGGSAGRVMPPTSDATVDTSSSFTSGQSQGQQLDLKRLQAWLQHNVPEFPARSHLTARQFSLGQSNPTFFLEAGSAKYVLRKKPHGTVLASAHAVDREFRVLAALKDTAVPVPRAVCLCEDDSVLGAPFYIMEHLHGRVFTDSGLPGLQPSERLAVYAGMARTLAALHSVQPDRVGLSGYGRTTGYCARQVWRWSRQYAAQLDGEPLPEMQKVMQWLEQNVPESDSDPAITRISHGDYKLDNLLFHASQPDTVLGVLDWELSTLGHPLADLAYSAMAYRLPAGLVPGGMASLPDPPPKGIPSEAEYVQIYCRQRGIPAPSPRDWAFFLALGLFRMAAILAGVGARARQGNASSARAAEVGSTRVVSGFARAALGVITSMLGPNALAVASQQQESPGHSLLARVQSGGQASTTSPSAGNDDAQSWGLGPSPRGRQLLQQLCTFMREHVEPAEPAVEEHSRSDRRWQVSPVIEELKRKAQRQGLWNLFIPPGMAALYRGMFPDTLPRSDQTLLLGPGLSNLDYAHLAEEMGRIVWASEVFNCAAPDTGNMEVLARYGSLQQQQAWLLPLLKGEIRSCFAMTEPAVASSDATNIQSSIQRQGASWVLNGHKWWASGATDPRCHIAIFMGKSSPKAAQHKQQSMVLVPLASPGVKIVRPLTVMGFDDAPHGHAEVLFQDVRVPLEAMILGEGRGFEIAQGRLGPGRLHHCMRTIGIGQRAVQLMATRAQQRTAFGRPIAGHGAFVEKLAEARISLDSARLVVLDAAATLDAVGNKLARKKIAQAKVVAPRTVLAILDEAMQTHGGAGLSQDTPLAKLYAQTRTLRLADGPDAVHLASIGKLELKEAAQRAQPRSKL